MRALITGDIHLNDNIHDDYRIRFLRTFRDLCSTQKVDTAIILGDLTDKKDNHGAWLVNQVVDHFYKLADICKNVIVIKGNHDYLDPEWPFYRFLQRIDRVFWINRPTIHRFVETGVFLCLPHTSNPKRDWKDLDTKHLDARHNDFIFCHQTFKGATAGFGKQLEGIDPDELLPGNASIISGDIHEPQQLERVTYVGAPYTINFGDNYGPRVLLLDGDRRMSIKCPGPQKRLIEADSLAEFKKLCEKRARPKDMIKARIAIKDLVSWSALKEDMRSWCNEQELVVHTIQPILNSGSRMKERVVEAQRSDQERLRDYAKLRNVDGLVLKTGLSLLEEG